MRGKPSRRSVLAGTILCLVTVGTAILMWQTTRALAAAAGQNPPPAPTSARLTPEQLQQLVAPIALYPDSLVAQILAASAYPTQIVEAERFLQANPNLNEAALGSQIDQQDWDPSVKALTQFPSVLSNMNNNLSWTSELGDANYNQAADVMNAIQVMRQKAQEAGKLQTTPQQTVANQGSTIIIQPASPNVVYVPEYDPELVYGYPMPLWPGLNPWWGAPGPYISFGVGFGIGAFMGFGWGWHSWGCDWFHHGVLYGGGGYLYHTHAFYDRDAYFHGNFRGYRTFGPGDRALRGFAGGGPHSLGRAGGPQARGYGGARRSGGWGGRGAGPAARSWGRTGAFGGFSHGGDTRTFSARGRTSMGGMHMGGFGAMRGGGGMHGGSGMRGGGPHR